MAERSAFDVPAPASGDLLFEFSIDRCLLTTSSGHGDPAPTKTAWRRADQA